MNKFDKESFTYGMELELGDVDRTIDIPKHLGKWDYSETDIINLLEPYKNVCSDPQGINPPVGGEINTYPTKTIKEQVEVFRSLKDLLPTATVCTTAHTHIHCYVPNLKDDIEALKRLTKYISENQADAIEVIYGYQELPNMKQAKGAKMYMKYDGGRMLPEYIANNIENLATDFNSFIKMHCAGKDGVSMGRPFRYAINMYSLKHIGTIEFRLFRATLDDMEIASCLQFCKDFLDAALNNGDSVKELLAKKNYKFPKMIWDLDQFNGWNASKYPKERGKKERTFIEL